MTFIERIISKCHTVSMLDKGFNKFTLDNDEERAERCRKARDKTLEELETLYIEKFQMVWWWND
jgi:hypothetical protein